ncbi:MAG: response regulator [Anaerolineae bacterium]|nr:response regulator [Anaerolineae bacterium]
MDAPDSNSSIARALDRLSRRRILAVGPLAAATLAALWAFAPHVGLLLSLVTAGLVGLAVYFGLTVLARDRTVDELEMMVAQEQDNVIQLNTLLTKARARLGELAADLEEEHATSTVLSGETRDLQARMNALNDRLLTLNKQLDTLGRTKSEFLARMSHELRTPLNSIVGYTELVLDGMYGKLTDQQRDRLDRVLRNGRHLLGLINDILDIAEIDSGHLELNFTNVDIANALQLAVATCEPRAHAKGLAISFEMAGDLPPISADELRLRQMVVSLLDNAIKFTDVGDIRVKAGYLRVDEDGGSPSPRLGPGSWLVISVIDTGIGIPPELHEEIFGEFVQADTSATRAHGGSGLGLTVTQRLVHLHGGAIWLKSVPGEGSTFSLAIPYDGAASVGSPETTRLGPSSQPLILVVDDEEDARDIIGHYLVQAGYRVAYAENGTRALKLVQQLYPDAVVLDILMPDIDGWGVLERLHAEPQTTGVTVVTISIMDQQRRARKQGAVTHLSKPIDRELLLSAVAQAVSVGVTPPVLVVDDDRAVRNAFTAVLRTTGYHAIPLESADAAIEWLQNRRASLVLLCIDGPDDDMHRLLDFIQSHPPSAGIPTVVIADDAASLQTVPGGRVWVLRKRGLAQQELLETIDRAMAEVSG